MFSIKHIVSLAILIGVAHSFICPPSSLMTRTIDGTCNNLLFKNWGKSGAFYENGPEGRESYPAQHIWQLNPRPKYEDFHLLPDDGPRGNSRNISNILCTRTDEEEETVIDEVNHSMLSTMFGQFITHDLDNNRMVNASSRDYFPVVTYIKDFEDDVCQPIPFNNFGVPEDYRCGPDDEILTSEARASGVEFMSDGTVKVYNNATAYLDLDTVYGRSLPEAAKLRLGTHGKLLTKESETYTIHLLGPHPPIPYGPYTFEDLLPTFEQTGLPVNPSFSDEERGAPWHTLFTAGDQRVNENIALSFYHLLFMREHNRICDELIQGNLVWRLFPSLFDDVIFEKARQINIAQYQRIVYEQYFKSAFGQYNADLLGEYSGYNPLVETTTSLPFASAVFRYGHFVIRNYFALDECGQAISFGVPAADQNEKMTFLGMGNQAPDYLHPLGQLCMAGGWENIARGLINERSAPNILSAHTDIRNLRLPTPAGVLDLITLDIARARYNHLPNYQTIRKHYHGLDPVTNNIYGLPGCPASLENEPDTDDPIECYTAITSDIEQANELRSVYRKVNLIDAIIGVTAEDKIPGTSFGRTSSSLIVRQFKKVRDGDRFFYKSPFMQAQFSHAERQNIATVTMSDIMRRNLVGLDIPNNPFESPEDYRGYLQSKCNA